MLSHCGGVRRDLTAYADQALGASRRDQVASHLVGCVPCRAELDEIRRVRSLLTQERAAEVPAPAGGLADRLVAIAGEEADRELWLAPDGCRALPSPRRRRRRRVLAAVSMTTCGVLGALGSAWLVAPPLPRIEDPDSLAVGAASGLLGTSNALATARPAVGVMSSVGEPDCPRGFSCPESLLGMPRLRMQADSQVAPQEVRSLYAWADSQVLVVQQHGQLVGEPDELPGLYVDAWQSGETVYCVIANNSFDARQAAASLPHEDPVTGQGLQRVRLGWETMLGQR